MAVATTFYHRNHESSDSTLISREGSTYVTPETIGWSAPSGYSFNSWNTQANGSGTTYNVGDTCTGLHVYAIWEVTLIPYLVTSTDLTSIADAIRTKGGTSAALEWPTGFVSAIQNISGGGSSDLVDVSGTFMAANVHLNPEILKAVVDSDVGIVFFYAELDLSADERLEIFAPSGYWPPSADMATFTVYLLSLGMTDLAYYDDSEGYWAYSAFESSNCFISGAYRITV